MALITAKRVRSLGSLPSRTRATHAGSLRTSRPNRVGETLLRFRNEANRMRNCSTVMAATNGAEMGVGQEQLFPSARLTGVLLWSYIGIAVNAAYRTARVIGQSKGLGRLQRKGAPQIALKRGTDGQS